MKYRKYILSFIGKPEIVSFLSNYIQSEWPSLGEARKYGRAAKLLFGVEYNVKSIIVSGPIV